MKMIVTPKTRKQQKAVKDLLIKLEVDFSVVEEDTVAYRKVSKNISSPKPDEKTTIPEWQKNFVARSIKKYTTHPELLISEKEAWKIIDAKG